MLGWSLAVAVTGSLLSVVVGVLLKHRFEIAPERYWLLGLGGLAPAWLVALLAVLHRTPLGEADTPLPPAVLGSSSVALLGIIVTDFLIRRLQRSGRLLSPVLCWLAGTVAFIPAWAVVLWALGD